MYMLEHPLPFLCRPSQMLTYDGTVVKSLTFGLFLECLLQQALEFFVFHQIIAINIDLSNQLQIRVSQRQFFDKHILQNTFFQSIEQTHAHTQRHAQKLKQKECLHQERPWKLRVRDGNIAIKITLSKSLAGVGIPSF